MTNLLIPYCGIWFLSSLACLAWIGVCVSTLRNDSFPHQRDDIRRELRTLVRVLPCLIVWPLVALYYAARLASVVAQELAK